ncbi:MAG: hypothetical protein QNJ12_23250 [Ilumatobacter sp.]|uniref:hypothetical protein n=1 Tax=Ilumatobacter sp. TaxID=1967498 RepID=UPI00261E873E|nr:hypothetical protein [Ilumatobacter sp.]MDJ0771723.1 hypothetical protein [Ilumatobacter sp.]
MDAAAARARPLLRRGSPRRITAALVALCSAFAVVPASTSSGAGSSNDPAAFRSVEPCRLFDSRDAARRLRADSTVEIDVAGRCGVGEDAVAAALTVTAVEPQGFGFVSAYPAGTARPTASTVNHRPGQVIANGQLTRLGHDGAVALYTLANTHLVVDVSGYFVAAPEEGSAAGRFVPVDIHRLVDTRETHRPAPRSSVRVVPDVPADAVAVAVNITTTATNGPDFFTTYPAGGTRPLASVLNADAANQTRAASVIAPVSQDGFDVFTLKGNHVIVDITGYFTGPTAPVSTDGLFVGAAPTRLVDTRLSHGPSGGPRLWDGGTREFDVAAITGGPVGSIAANVTVTQTEAPGFVTMYPARTRAPASSTVNYDAGLRTVANSSIAQVSEAGIAIAASEATHLVVDVTGWFTGTPVAATRRAAANWPPLPRRVTIISDSAMAGVRWNGALGGLQGFEPIAKLESCRRLVQASCRGREGYAPLTAQQEILALPSAGPEELLVVAVGYNDWHARFSSDFDLVVGAARAKGFRHIMWVTYRSQVGYTLPGSGGTLSNYGEMNRVLREKVASDAYPEVRLWDLDAYTRSSVGWFTADGVHETQLGSWGVADWLSRHVRAFDDKPCVQPWTAGGAPEAVCPNPDPMPSWAGLPDVAGIYGL